MNKIIKLIDTTTQAIGKFAGLITIVLVSLVLFDTLNRYLFTSGSIALQELEWHLFDALFLLGIAYALKHNTHVRVDLFYEHYSIRKKALINILGLLFLVIPFSAFIFESGYTFALDSFEEGEISPNPGGLEYRFIIKSVISISFAMVLLQSFAELLKSINIFRKKYEPHH
jgi:TRAP-type mannitol/chloroaromatic compound transport system permease small subunit